MRENPIATRPRCGGETGGNVVVGIDNVVSGDEVDVSGRTVDTGATVSTVVSVVSALANPDGTEMPSRVMSATMRGCFFIVGEIVIAEFF